MRGAERFRSGVAVNEHYILSGYGGVVGVVEMR